MLIQLDILQFTILSPMNVRVWLREANDAECLPFVLSYLHSTYKSTHIASSPGHTQLFNVHEKMGGPGMQRHMTIPTPEVKCI